MERPEWHIRDTIQSIKDLGSLVLDTLAEMIPIDFEIKDVEHKEED